METRAKWKKWLLLSTSIVIVSAISIVIGQYITSRKPASPTATSPSSEFSTLVKNLPAGYQTDLQSIEREGGALAYVAKTSDGRLLVISEQPRPSEARLNKFITENIKNSNEVEDASYPAILGDGPLDSKLLSILHGDTWITVNASHPQSEDDLTFIARNLR